METAGTLELVSRTTEKAVQLLATLETPPDSLHDLSPVLSNVRYMLPDPWTGVPPLGICVHDPHTLWQFFETQLEQRLPSLTHSWHDTLSKAKR